MKFTVMQRTFLKELGILQGVFGSGKSKADPILTNVLIRVSESKINLSATDLSVSISTDCKIESLTATPGEIVVPGKKLLSIIQEFDNVLIDFELQKNGWLRLSSGGSDYKIIGQSSERFPLIPYIETYSASIPKNLILGQISRTKYAIPDKEEKYKGVHITLADNVMTMVAVDGHQLPVVISNITFPDNLVIFLPELSIMQLSNLLSDDENDGLVFIGINDNKNHVFFKMGDRELTSILMAEPFPAYERMLPKDNNQIIKLNTSQFTRAIKRAITVADKKSPTVLIEIDEGIMTITSQSVDVGNGKENFPVETNGIKEKIALNTDYLLPCLTAAKTETINMEIKNGESPVIFRPIGEENFSWLTVVMPSRQI